MRLLDLTLPAPDHNLALDEALFELAEEDGSSWLRFWEPPGRFVVLGYANRAAAEADLDRCRALSIPVLRRTTGGGAVLQGPGVLNYTLVLPSAGPLSTITATNRHVMERHAAALAPLLGRPLELRGDTDLTLDGRKVSGNSQRRGRRTVLFHGTFLAGLDLALIAEALPVPTRAPAYRAGRGHAEFCTNLPLTPGAIRRALVRAWNARPWDGPLPEDRLERLVREQYGNQAWNLRR